MITKIIKKIIEIWRLYGAEIIDIIIILIAIGIIIKGGFSKEMFIRAIIISTIMIGYKYIAIK
jgi:hypothetical protein